MQQEQLQYGFQWWIINELSFCLFFKALNKVIYLKKVNLFNNEVSKKSSLNEVGMLMNKIVAADYGVKLMDT